MQLTRLSLYRLSLPMLAAFEHSGASRESTDNIVCCVTFDDGTEGFGEGVARSYVTGETSELSWQLLSVSVAQQNRQLAVASVDDALREMRRWAECVPDRRGAISNASRSALELAIADALFKRLRTSPVEGLSKLVGLPSAPRAPNLSYSMVAGKGLLAAPDKMREFLDRYGYRAVKAKVGFGLEEDLENLKRVRDVFGSDADVRVDANRAWTYEQAATFLDRARKLGVKTIEDPIVGAKLADMLPLLSKLRAETGCEIVLDEPIRTLSEAMAAVESKAADVISVRISKCGGLMRSMDIAAACESAGVAVQLGCQVGETAILSAAGRRFAESVGNLRYLEGSNERLKFAREYDVCEEEMMYGPDARGAVLTAPGLGLTVSRERLLALSSDVVEFDY